MKRETADVTMWIEDAVTIETYLDDFNGSVQEWKLAFYEVWRYQMTYSFAYKIRVGERHGGAVYMSLLVKPAFKKDILETLKGLGCGKITVDAEKVGVIDDCDLYDIDTSICDVVSD